MGAQRWGSRQRPWGEQAAVLPPPFLHSLPHGGHTLQLPPALLLCPRWG